MGAKNHTWCFCIANRYTHTTMSIIPERPIILGSSHNSNHELNTTLIVTNHFKGAINEISHCCRLLKKKYFHIKYRSPHIKKAIQNVTES